MELPKSLNKYAKVFGGEEIQRVYAEQMALAEESANQIFRQRLRDSDVVCRLLVEGHTPEELADAGATLTWVQKLAQDQKELDKAVTALVREKAAAHISHAMVRAIEEPLPLELVSTVFAVDKNLIQRFAMTDYRTIFGMPSKRERQIREE